MDNTIRGQDSLSSSSSDQAINCKGWERFLPKRPLRVLLVEDDGSTLQVVYALLSKCGYEVSCAKDATEAWDLLEQSKQVFDLVLADAMMPGLSGTDLLARIMANEAHREIPVIMMSSHDSLDMVFKCLLKGAKDFLVKPLRKNELRNLWQHVWRRNHVLGGFGSQGVGHGKKRKASWNLCSGDSSNDNFSVSYGEDDQNAKEDERNTHCVGVCQSDHKCEPLLPNLDCSQLVGGKYNDACTAPETSKFKNFSPPSEKKVESPISVDASEDYGTSAKAFEFFGTIPTDSISKRLSAEVHLGKETATSSQKCQASPALELTLNRTSSTGDAGRDPAIKHSVLQSDCSAFSRYTSTTTLTHQPSIVRSASLPSDKENNGCGPIESAPHSVDGQRTSMDICGRVNDATPVPENCTLRTLHFPKATHFQHGRQFRHSPFTQISSCCDESCRKDFRSLSINSSAAANSLFPLAKEVAVPGSDHGSRLNVQKDVNRVGSLAGSTWGSGGSDQDDLSSNNAKLGQFFPCTNGDCMHTNADNYGLYEHPDNMPSSMEGFTNLKSASELPSYTMVSGRGSNDGSDGGSSVLEEHLTGRSQNGHSLSGWHANENGKMDMDGHVLHTFDESNATDQRSLVFDYRRSSFREAALHKFRQKRKLRCFEKKVRYQSRKKLAEQRPRVKGQFVRRVIHDPTAEANTTS